jgi:protein arginine N-methyltransferase 5
VLQILADAKDKQYDTICLPLTTAHWRTRWREMCVLPGGEDRQADALAQQRAEAWRAQPAFLREEVTVTRLGPWVLFSQLAHPTNYLSHIPRR